ncbi:FRG domain-containing protein [Pedobacter sp. ASV12]|uniref:FRG domain-containing protein n=1 Tax=Pedobacter sp. ASV12 TaxID=2795120 RepID=UPI0018EC8279|nr:FRG domain-containing protein [Pedobacter sp. ASV12]
MLKPISLNDDRLRYPGYFNIYPIIHEVSQYGRSSSLQHKSFSDFLLDENYGRIINSEHVYGSSATMPYHLRDFPERVIGHFRVPMRKIPIYKFNTLSEIKPFLDLLNTRYPDFEVLLRGQHKVYTIERSPEEKKMLFGEELVKEPSLLPSFSRLDFNEFFIYNLWHSYTAMMLDDIGIDLRTRLLDYQHRDYLKDVTKIKGHPHFTFIALGIAQHYGLPSVGLDLTKDIRVASWFASHHMDTEKGITTIRAASDFSDSTIFIFKCPKDQVFAHKQIKPKFIEHSRPDRQDAWFCHTGWGCAKNQAAENLIAAIRLDESVLGEFDIGYHRFLFPDRDEDLMLNFFLDVKESGDLKGEAKRAFEKIYKLHDLHL